MSWRRLGLLVSLVLISGVAGGVWWLNGPSDPPEEVPAGLPIPPFPPRITEGRAYETCLAALAGDPVGAVALAESWEADGGGDGAVHGGGLALIAVGNPAAGAVLLEQLAQRSTAPPMARASVLGQAVQA